jgi:hypothetical protein
MCFVASPRLSRSAISCSRRVRPHDSLERESEAVWRGTSTAAKAADLTPWVSRASMTSCVPSSVAIRLGAVFARSPPVVLRNAATRASTWRQTASEPMRRCAAPDRETTAPDSESVANGSSSVSRRVRHPWSIAATQPEDVDCGDRAGIVTECLRVVPTCWPSHRAPDQQMGRWICPDDESLPSTSCRLCLVFASGSCATA